MLVWHLDIAAVCIFFLSSIFLSCLLLINFIRNNDIIRSFVRSFVSVLSVRFFQSVVSYVTNSFRTDWWIDFKTMDTWFQLQRSSWTHENRNKGFVPESIIIYFVRRRANRTKVNCCSCFSICSGRNEFEIKKSSSNVGNSVDVHILFETLYGFIWHAFACKLIHWCC